MRQIEFLSWLRNDVGVEVILGSQGTRTFPEVIFDVFHPVLVLVLSEYRVFIFFECAGVDFLPEFFEDAVSKKLFEC